MLNNLDALLRSGLTAARGSRPSKDRPLLLPKSSVHDAGRTVGPTGGIPDEAPKPLEVRPARTGMAHASPCPDRRLRYFKC